MARKRRKMTRRGGNKMFRKYARPKRNRTRRMRRGGTGR